MQKIRVYPMQLEAGVTAILPTPITVTEVIAFGSGGRANTSQDFRVMTPYLEILLSPERPLFPMTANNTV